MATEIDEVSIWKFSSLGFVAMMVFFAVCRVYQTRKAANKNFVGTVFSVAALTQMAILFVNVYFATAVLFMIALLANLSIGVYLFSPLLRVTRGDET